jgi:acyl-CoA thioesterase
MTGSVLESLKEQIRDEPFANHMGIRLRDIGPGYAVMEARFSEKMRNFNGLIHGGAIFALMDEAFGAASNSHGTIALALNLNVIFLQTPKINSMLIAEAKEESRNERTASYRIEVLQKNENGDQKIALCQALVYRKDKSLSFLEREPREIP